ncbi:helix-turn-helix transcriptional regulator [Ruegeria lacuscaerulensis]|uniref:helix-turn-helix transcriptional regulator n=1 Tax=Ruegeria lacuscaerulensis TaxID=55218 RepID=UPI001BE3E7A8|nr:AlpA family phage regulatory protein [Ruegeria lacuscaerulensis]
MHVHEHLNVSSEPPGAKEVAPPISGLQPILIGHEELQELGITYCKEHLRRLEADGLFPPRIRLSPVRVVWAFNEVIAWINDRAEERGVA